MEAIRQIVKVPKDHEIRMKVPHHILENEMVEMILIVKSRPENFDKKVSALRSAMKDELFLADLKEVSDDFSSIDLQKWD